jgi:hypothetical protein
MKRLRITQNTTTQTVPTNMSSSKIARLNNPTEKQSTTSEGIEEEPELEPQDLLIWGLEHNKFERFSSLLKVPGVDPKFK